MHHLSDLVMRFGALGFSTIAAFFKRRAPGRRRKAKIKVFQLTTPNWSLYHSSLTVDLTE
jgi:hypothetical protein